MYERIMTSLFPMIIVSVTYYVQMVSFPYQPFFMYIISAIPAGWSMLNRYKQQMTETDRIIRAIRMQNTDGIYELIFYFIKKVIKLAVAFAIGWLMVPFQIFEVLESFLVANERKTLKELKES